jgi:hypothetical protein
VVDRHIVVFEDKIDVCIDEIVRWINEWMDR